MTSQLYHDLPLSIPMSLTNTLVDSGHVTVELIFINGSKNDTNPQILVQFQSKRRLGLLNLFCSMDQNRKFDTIQDKLQLFNIKVTTVV